MLAAVVKQDGLTELFYEAEDGEVLHTWQTAPTSTWHGAEAGKRHAAWESMGKPQNNRVS